MPLQDHFHEPLSSRRSWTAFHSAWATYIVEDLNERLGSGFFAEPLAQFSIEIDVATWQEADDPLPPHGWKPAAPQLTLPFTLASDVVVVLIHRNEGGATLVGAVELVRPDNKDRPANREAFLSKCSTYLHQGVGLVVVDIVTSRTVDFHQALIEWVCPKFQLPPPVSPPANAGGSPSIAHLHASAYRPLLVDEQARLEVWNEPLALGKALPTLPLWLKGGHPLPLDLEATYQRTVQKLKLPVNGQA